MKRPVSKQIIYTRNSFSVGGSDYLGDAGHVVGATQTQTCRYKLVVAINTSSDLRVWGCEHRNSYVHRGDGLWGGKKEMFIKPYIKVVFLTTREWLRELLLEKFMWHLKSHVASLE